MGGVTSPPVRARQLLRAHGAWQSAPPPAAPHGGATPQGDGKPGRSHGVRCGVPRGHVQARFTAGRLALQRSCAPRGRARRQRQAGGRRRRAARRRDAAGGGGRVPRCGDQRIRAGGDTAGDGRAGDVRTAGGGGREAARGGAGQGGQVGEGAAGRRRELPPAGWGRDSIAAAVRTAPA